MKIYYLPGESVNSYILNMMNILEINHEVASMPEVNEYWLFLSQIKKYRGSIIILNWFEDKTAQKNSILKLIYRILYIFMVKFSFKKIIWVRHNFKPHDKYNPYVYEFFCNLLYFISDEKITHRNVLGYKYIPHPLYKKHIGNSAEIREIDYLYFGVISRYKGLVKLLNNWAVSKKLVIRGACKDKDLFDELVSIILNRGLDVDIENVFLDEKVLEEMINNSKYVVLPHDDKSMIVSGSFYHAASLGANVKVFKSEFYNFCKEKFSFVSEINDDDEIGYVEPSVVLKESLNECSNNKVLMEMEKYI